MRKDGDWVTKMGGLPCKQKIILNGLTIQSELHALCYQVEQLKDLDDTTGYEIVGYLNHAENLVFAAKRAYLESQGFHGPWPKSLMKDGET